MTTRTARRIRRGIVWGRDLAAHYPRSFGVRVLTAKGPEADVTLRAARRSFARAVRAGD